MDLHRCDDCGGWHLTLTDAEFAALAYLADDWSDATANAEEEGDLETPADVTLWRHAQRFCSAVVEQAIVYTDHIIEQIANPNGMVH